MPGRALARSLAALSLLVAAFAAREAHACDSCAAPAATLPAPMGACQFVAGSTDSSCRQDVYAVELVAGESYTFTLCEWTCTGAAASFNARLRLRDDSCAVLADIDDSWCGTAPEISWIPGTTGTHFIEILGSGSADVGTYRLGYLKQCWDDDCWTPAGDLGAVTTSCQLRAGDVDCASRTYSVTLVQGQRYTFSLCGTTCPGADASFDTTLELYDPFGSLITTSTAACADDGEIVYSTDPFDGGGSYCVRVRADAGGGRFVLGYRVACQAPSTISLSPLSARATQPGCSEIERFTVTTSGTPDFTTSWSITPPAGGSASPASGTFPMSSTSGQFQSTLRGVGLYRVSVTVENECGRATQVFDHDLQDRTAPDLTLTASPGCGPPPPAPAPLPVPPAPAASAPREMPEDLLHAAQVKQDALDADTRDVLDARMPGLRRRPEARSLSCATPCDVSILQAAGVMYDVAIACNDGSFTARTGAAHPVTLASGFGQNVIYGGSSGTPGTSDIGFMFHDVDVFYQDPGGGRACVFDPPDTASEPSSVGIEMEWDVEPVPGLLVTLREEIVAFGTDENDSGVRLTLGASVSPSSALGTSMGVRWQIDYQNGGDDGPFFATVSCNPPQVVDVLEVEHELPASEILDFYRIQNNTGDPVFSNFTNTTEIAGFPDTGKPDRLVYGYWPSMVSGFWDRFTNEGDPNVDFDSAVHYWFGHDASTAIPLAPGESFTRSVVIFTSGENVDCGGFTPGNAANATIVACEGDCIELGALAVDACGAATATLVESSPGAPACAGNPCEATFPVPGTYQYTWEATDAAGNATRAVTTVQVLPVSECQATGCTPTGAAPPPVMRACAGEDVILDASSLGLTGCTGALRFEWREGARVIGAGTTLRVSPAATTTYVVMVTCETDPACFTSAAIRVEIDRVPVAGAVAGRDERPCSLGIDVTWEPAAFFNGGGVYNVFRSEASCADALLRAPLATGLTGTSFRDLDTRAGARYFYVVQAEDLPAGSPCLPPGVHHGGPSDLACAPFISDASDTEPPTPPWDALRVSHRGQSITLDWTRARALTAGEHVHVLKASASSGDRLEHASPEGWTARTWSDTDTASPLQFFDVRFADACENVSPAEYPIYPPGYDIPR